ncbi:hypothetical protein [Microbacterium sp. 18062]|uniref:hypothetical protein n=1 Tax=Microbacterium sp. 18062 TaxID=2681410 RepID=UPI001F1B9B71|nr:hypothetical protein [Microbacterium sp. 18062]
MPGISRVPLARAIALDTISAAAACTDVARVAVVTGDTEIATTFVGDLRVSVVPDGAYRRDMEQRVRAGFLCTPSRARV